MKRFHLALGVADVERSITEYTDRLSAPPQVVVPGEYALWRTASLNFSIRRSGEKPGTLRHVGWEDSDAAGFVVIEQDGNGLAWERFNAEAQAEEIRRLWPAANVPREQSGRNP
ncbi:MAG: hypothetical protein ACJ8KO_04755 [Sulfurifustaceae bacterium]